MMILETHVDLLDVDRPAIAYYRLDECANDSSNWCGPNGAGGRGDAPHRRIHPGRVLPGGDQGRTIGSGERSRAPTGGWSSTPGSDRDGPPASSAGGDQRPDVLLQLRATAEGHAERPQLARLDLVLRPRLLARRHGRAHPASRAIAATSSSET